MRVVVTFVDGPLAGQQQIFDHPSIIRIGRHPDCDVAIDSQSAPGVSAHQAEIREEDGGLVLYDLHSANGTYVALEKVGRRPLSPGDTIRLGEDGPSLAIGYRVEATATEQLSAKAEADGDGAATQQQLNVAEEREGPSTAQAASASFTAAPTNTATVSPALTVSPAPVASKRAAKERAAEKVVKQVPVTKPAKRWKRLLLVAGILLGGFLAFSLVLGLYRRHQAAEILGDGAAAPTTEPVGARMKALRSKIKKVSLDFPEMAEPLTKEEILKELDKFVE